MNPAIDLKLNHFFRALTETCTDAILLVDSATKIVFANRKGGETFGLDPEELIGKNVLSLLSLPQEQEARLPLQHQFSPDLPPSDIPTTLSVLGQRPDGKMVSLQLTVNPWHDQDHTLYNCLLKETAALKTKQDEIELVLSTIEAISQAADFDAAIGTTIRRVCQLTGWEYGEAWIPDREQQKLHYSSQWYTKAESLAGFSKACAALEIKSGQSMVGRAFQNQVEYFPDVSILPEELFFRRELALQYGLRAGLAIPIATNGEVLAVLAFFMGRSQEQDQTYTNIISSLARQLGTVLRKKKIEQKLKESEEKYRSIFEKSADPALVIVDGQFADCNPATLDLLAAESKEEVILRHPAELSPEYQPDGRLSREKAEEMIELAIQKGWHRFEWVHSKKSGEEVWLEVSLTTITPEEKPLLYTTWRNITDRKELESIQERQREYLGTILENVEDGIVGCDPQGTLTFFNRAARLLHGREEQPLSPEKWAQAYGYFQPDGSTPLRMEEIPLYRALQGELVQNVEMVIRNPDKGPRNVYCSGRRILSKTGQNLGAVVVNHDITGRKNSEVELNHKNQVISQAYEELKSAEQELIHANSQLEKRVKIRTEELSVKNLELYNKNLELIRINSDLDNFVYIASHDLKVPLLNMEALMGILRTELVEENPESLFVFRKFEQAIRRMKQTIQDVTEVAKAQRKMVERLEKVPFGAVLDEVKLSIENLIVSTGAVINQDFEEAPTILYSQINLKSILYNLLSNSLLYRSPDRTPEISLRTHKAEGSVVLTVQDNGLGINLERGTEKLFGMFTRLHTHVEGSGIGLYIVNRLVQNQGGRIEVVSEPNKGATFLIYLPDL